MKKHCIMTITSVRNGTRDYPLTWSGIINTEHEFIREHGLEGTYAMSLLKSEEAWKNKHIGRHHQGFVVDFYRTEEIKDD